MIDIKKNLLEKQIEYNRKLDNNYNDFANLINLIKEIEENFYYAKEVSELKNNNNRVFNRDLLKLKSYIDLIKQELNFEENIIDFIDKVNKNEKKMTNFIQDKFEEETENTNLLLSKKDLRKSLNYSSKNSLLPMIYSPIYTVKHHKGIMDDMNSSYYSETELERIININLDKYTLNTTNHSEYSSLLSDEKYLRKVNKELLKRLENLDLKYEKQYNTIFESIKTYKENLNFIKKVINY